MTREREQVNPQIVPTTVKATDDGTQEREAAKMPGVGSFPTGKKAAKKATPGMG